MEMKTRKEFVETLSAAGLSEAGVEFLAQITGPARHRSRVEEAKKAAHLHLWDVYVPDTSPESAAEVAFLAVLDACGIGGYRGTGQGGGTARFPAFENLGSGRRHAMDGGAWSAAIHELACTPWEGRPVWGVVEIRAGLDDDKVPTLFVRVTDETWVDVGMCLRTMKGEPRTPEEEDAAPWHAALARRGLLWAALREGVIRPEDVEGWEDPRPEWRGHGGAITAADFHGTAAAWSQYLQEVEAAIERQRLQTAGSTRSESRRNGRAAGPSAGVGSARLR